MNSTFTVTENHIKLLRRAYVGWENCEYGAPAIDCKRPYGNSSVERDIAEILGWPFDEEEGLSDNQSTRASLLHTETRDALQIFLVTGKMETGEYYKTDRYDDRSWRRAK